MTQLQFQIKKCLVPYWHRIRLDDTSLAWAQSTLSGTGVRTAPWAVRLTGDVVPLQGPLEATWDSVRRHGVRARTRSFEEPVDTVSAWLRRLGRERHWDRLETCVFRYRDDELARLGWRVSLVQLLQRAELREALQHTQEWEEALTEAVAEARFGLLRWWSEKKQCCHQDAYIDAADALEEAGL